MFGHTDEAHDRLDIELESLVEGRWIHQVALEHNGTSEPVGEVVVADRGDCDVQLHGINPAPEDSGGHTTVEDAGNHAHEAPADDLDCL